VPTEENCEGTLDRWAIDPVEQRLGEVPRCAFLPEAGTVLLKHPAAGRIVARARRDLLCVLNY